MVNAYIGVGANLGDRAKALCRAASLLEACQDLNILSVSHVYETTPIGTIKQRNFFNAVLQVETGLSARELLKLLLDIENKFGRVRKEKWGPRILDLDILLYGNSIIREEGLLVPHPYMHQRLFVLIPLCDLNPSGFHPKLKKTFGRLARLVRTRQNVKKIRGLALFKEIG